MILLELEGGVVVVVEGVVVIVVVVVVVVAVVVVVLVLGVVVLEVVLEVERVERLSLFTRSISLWALRIYLVMDGRLSTRLAISFQTFPARVLVSPCRSDMAAGP